MRYFNHPFIAVLFLTVLTACGGSSSEPASTASSTGSGNNAVNDQGGESDPGSALPADDNSLPESISVGVLLGFTGPIESLAVPHGIAAETAIAEVSESASFLGGKSVVSVRADSTCVDSQVATTAFTQLLEDNVAGVVGPSCSGSATAVLQNAAVPTGMVMISPSATSPSLSTIETNGLFFRTAPSDALEPALLSQIILDRGIQTAAITYVNDAYGQGQRDVFTAAFEANGGAVTTSLAHEDGKTDYSLETSALSTAGGDILVVLGYFDEGGGAIVQEAVNVGAFSKFALNGSMINESLLENVDGLNGSFGISIASTAGSEEFNTLQSLSDDFDASTPYVAESYDAAALLLLAMQAAESTDPNTYKTKVFDVANSPGQKIYPGELAKALDLLAAGNEIDYEGATNVELIGSGDDAGSFQELEISNNELVKVRLLNGKN